MSSASKAIAAPSKAFQSTLRMLAAFHEVENISFSGLNILILVVPPATRGMVRTPRASREEKRWRPTSCSCGGQRATPGCDRGGIIRSSPEAMLSVDGFWLRAYIYFHEVGTTTSYQGRSIPFSCTKTEIPIEAGHSFGASFPGIWSHALIPVRGDRYGTGGDTARACA